MDKKFSVEQGERLERGQTIVSSGGIWFAPSADVEVRVSPSPWQGEGTGLLQVPSF
ncbi:MAG: hypothetical protein KJ609_05245 [Gammaproteobacteria bacterium]|nr:hypothetical protein [Gammaproteobacteria bacterium]MBU2237219.1 hypothetical protein [Gammaproteobacteria bacterium]MBU2317935.1 hypothetical protein [Gammaproteobacteria bacterium]MBU2414168.1 hypothetical protein [Gammaproteobacteria bacterium]